MKATTTNILSKFDSPVNGVVNDQHDAQEIFNRLCGFPALYPGEHKPLHAARNYAATHGWSVLPVHHIEAGGKCSCGNRDCRSVGKHPRTAHGVCDASADLSQIDRWWDPATDPAAVPQAHIGIATGRVSGLIVLDVDDKPGRDGFTALRALEGRFGPLPDTATVRTRNGGRHYYFRFPADQSIEVQSSQDRLGPGIEVKADGRYVIAPPASQGYFWLKSPSEYPITELPDAWLRVLSAPAAQARSSDEPWDEGKLIEALEHISADGYEDWIKVGCALHHGSAGSRDALGVWRAWSESSAKYQDGECEEKWTGFSRDGGPQVGPGTIYHMAKQRGWRPTPSSASSYSCTDVGNGERLVQYHGEDLRYLHETEQWLVFDDQRWLVDIAGELDRRAKATARHIYKEALLENDEARRRALAKWAARSESADKISAMLRMARSERRVSITASQLDADKMLLGVNNGVVDLRTGGLRVARREDYITKQAHVDYHPGATCPEWERVLHRVFAGNTELIEFLQRAVGYSLTGRTDEQCLFVLHGTGANGKSTVVNVLRDMLGDYAVQTAADALMVRQNTGGASPEIARLRGARMVCAIETDDGQRLSESLVKQLTGQDAVVARHLYQSFFEYTPQFKLWLVANHKPMIRGDDHAIWRRIHLLPFEVQIPEAQRDRRLGDKLRRELPGILNWAMRGCLSWQEIGLAPPAVIREATEEYRRDMDVLGDFIEERCHLYASASATANDLYDQYKKWTEDTGHMPLNQTNFGRKLVERGLRKHRGTGGRVVYEGIGIGDGEVCSDTAPARPRRKFVLGEKPTFNRSKLETVVVDQLDRELNSRE